MLSLFSILAELVNESRIIISPIQTFQFFYACLKLAYLFSLLTIQASLVVELVPERIVFLLVCIELRLEALELLPAGVVVDENLLSLRS